MDTESEDATQRKFHGATDGWLEEAAEPDNRSGRLIKPPEVAKVVAFYLSDESGMMTGNLDRLRPVRARRRRRTEATLAGDTR